MSTDDKQDPKCCVREVGELVQRLVRVFQLFERDQIKVHGFTSSQCYTLLELLKQKNISMNELSNKMNLDTSTMTRVIDNLVRDELVKRVRDETDRRFVVVELTSKGQSVSQSLSQSIEAYYQRIIENLPLGQTEQVLTSVQLLLTAFEKANPHCC